MAATEEPKRPMTAYFLYIQANRDAVQKELGVKGFGPVTKALSARWKGLGAEEKAVFEKQAADAKAEYEKAIEAFKAAGGAKAAKKAKKEANVESGKPSKPVGGAYGRYLAHHREEIQKSLPAGSKVTAVTKAAGEQWKALSAKDREKYEAEYTEMKAKYDKELTAWKEANVGDPTPKEAKTPPAKRPRAASSGKGDSTKKVRVTQAKNNRKAPPAAAAGVELERDIADKAEKAGITAVLQKLLAREDVAASGKSQAETS